MSYTKQNFTSGQTLTATHLNNMEAGIVANEQAIARVTNKPLKIIYVGNSYSQNATEYVYNILTNLGYSDFKVGILYKGGCSLATHLANLKENKADYDYQVCTASGRQSQGTKTIYEVLTSEDWSHVILQQKSADTDNAESYEDVYEVINYCKKYCPDASFGWHMTWENKNAVYADIANTVKTTILKNAFFDFIIPTGTAIQNASTSKMTHAQIWETDEVHLATSHPFGKMVASLATVKGILREKVNINNVTYKNTLTTEQFAIAKESVANMYKNPFTVTQSTYVS